MTGAGLDFRQRAPGTACRELGVLRAAINLRIARGRLTRTVNVDLPTGAEPRDRWLTRKGSSGIT